MPIRDRWIILKISEIRLIVKRICSNEENPIAKIDYSGFLHVTYEYVQTDKNHEDYGP